jgi:glycosyltransferase involved in cell wall biosynthesis
MTVLLVGNYALDRQYSMTAFQACLAERLPTVGLQAKVAVPEARLGAAPGRFRKWRAYVDKFLLFPRKLRKAAAECDVVHVCDQGNAMYLAHAGGRHTLLTCHDLLALRSARGEFPDWRTGRTGRALQEWIARSVPKATHVACVSTATIHDLDRLVPLCSGRRSLVLNGLYRPLVGLSVEEAKAVVAGFGLVPGGFLMHVGSNVPYKNRVVRIFAALQKTHLEGTPLVAAGGDWLPALAQEAERLRVAGQIVPLTHLTDREVAALYRTAAAFLFPSTMEGFGLPVIEAQGYDCPVFCSRIEPLLEIVADSAVTFDPMEPSQAAQTIAGAWAGRERLVEAGRQNVLRFETGRMVADYARLYAEI